jgi:type VII secretion integral membrane protein EccD
VAAHALLAATAAVAAAMALLQATPVTMLLTATVSAATLSAGGMVSAVVWHLPPPATGALTASMALVGLSVTPRVAIALAGLGPPPPTLDPPADETSADAAHSAHRLCTGLTVGCSTAAALGACFAATAGPTWATATFTAVLSAALVLRARSHVDAARRIALSTSGSVCAVALLALTAIALPHHIHWVGALAVLGAGGLAVCALAVTPGPSGRRLLDVAESLCLAAAAPVACWTGGLFGLVRTAGLL